MAFSLLKPELGGLIQDRHQFSDKTPRKRTLVREFGTGGLSGAGYTTNPSREPVLTNQVGEILSSPNKTS